jgi:hypothetical protein
MFSDEEKSVAQLDNQGKILGPATNPVEFVERRVSAKHSHRLSPIHLLHNAAISVLPDWHSYGYFG